MKIPQARIEIRCSNMLKGQIGLFALRNLRKGTIIAYGANLEEEFYPWSVYAKLDKQTRKMIDKYCASATDGFWGPKDINYLSLPWHMNHSCSGNVGFDENDNFITLKYVRAGEELCYDYSLIVTNPIFKLRCKCGAKNCRKLISGNDWKDPEYRKKNFKNMSPTLKKLIMSMMKNDRINRNDS